MLVGGLCLGWLVSAATALAQEESALEPPEGPLRSPPTLPEPAAAAPPRGEAPAPAPGTLFLFPERIPVEGGFAKAERGWLFVPANRENPDSHVIAVELWRFRAQEETATPPIFHLHGGPGFPGLETYLEDEDGDYYEQISRFTQIADYVVVGQRGIGASKPNTLCEAPGRGALNPWHASTLCRQFWEGEGLELEGLTVLEAAHDVADAARALGYDSLIVYGGSFGSHWGMALLRTHPELVARAVLSGMEGPNHTYDSPTGVLNSLERLAAAAERSEALRDLIPEGGLIAALRETIERTSTEAVTVTVEHPESGEPTRVSFTGSSVRGMALGYTRSVSSRAGARTWPADVLRLYHGDFADAARRRLERQAEAADDERFRTASFFMLDCGSGITAERLEELENDPARSVVGDRTAYYRMACPPWEADLGDAFRTNFDTDVPTLIVHGTWDVNTPLENALELAPHFRRGRLVRVEGGSHGAIGDLLDYPELGFRELLVNFLRTGDLSPFPEVIELPEPEWEVPEELVNTESGDEGPGPPARGSDGPAPTMQGHDG